MKILLVGCGKIGLRLGEKLTKEGHQVIGIKRTMVAANFAIVSADLNQSDTFNQLDRDIDVIIFTVTPTEMNATGYQQVYQNIIDQSLKFATAQRHQPLFMFVSSTRVYAQQNGEWVDEYSETSSNEFRSQWISRAEQAVKSSMKRALIIRFAGIYGQSRNRLISQLHKKQPINKVASFWTNRVHEDDCVQVLAFLIEQHAAAASINETYLVCDDMPAPFWQVCDYICQQYHLPEPSKQPAQQLGKRCSNQKIKDLGYQFLHQDYRSGYARDLS